MRAPFVLPSAPRAGSTMRRSVSGSSSLNVGRVRHSTPPPPPPPSDDTACDAWVDCGKMGGERGSYAEYAHDTVNSLEVFQGRLYGVPLYTQGLFCYFRD